MIAAKFAEFLRPFPVWTMPPAKLIVVAKAIYSLRTDLLKKLDDKSKDLLG
jgi:hypothetical protein